MELGWWLREKGLRRVVEGSGQGTRQSGCGLS